jgi:hypothetical protein
MFEYQVPEEHHIELTEDPARLFALSVGLLGDGSATRNRSKSDSDENVDLEHDMNFSAQFFNAYFESKLNETIDPYLLLLGSASYYLCNLPGSSSVLSNGIRHDDFSSLDAGGLEYLLILLLQGDFSQKLAISPNKFSVYVNGISEYLKIFFEDGTNKPVLIELSNLMRNKVYEYGTPRELLIGDVTSAVLRKKIWNSTWDALPRYTGLSAAEWFEPLQKESFMKELWPAQHLLGERDVLRGRSAVIQMPTSAGKTKANELIIRSAFLEDRTNLVIIVAPFRALCHEIKISLSNAFANEPIQVDEFTDVLQNDYVIADLLGDRYVIVVTPEKLMYAIRQSPAIAMQAGLVIFDEGHQFDNGTRGITYELLLTSLRMLIPDTAQKVLISAVISNAQAVGDWLNGEESEVIDGAGLIPTYRSIGFASWQDRLGRIEYASGEDLNMKEFFVPRVIESFKLDNKGRERKQRIFPEKNVGKDVALYLGLKLVSQGAVAVFCGRKATASSLCEAIADKFSRNLPMKAPSKYSNASEVSNLTRLCEQNLGPDASTTKSAKLGIFSHHGNTPHGIRLAVESAMRNDLIKFVICTSTLAQGVNLPIRYLIITSVYQGKEQIEKREFQNLIGRAGRAGMHTEGSILFADPKVFDDRKAGKGNWRWRQVMDLFRPEKTAPCISNLLALFDPISIDATSATPDMDVMDFVAVYIAGSDEVTNHLDALSNETTSETFSRESVESQMLWKGNLLSAVESFLLSNFNRNEGELEESEILELAENTLAFSLADDDKKKQIRALFLVLAENIRESIPEPNLRKVYGRTLYGLQDLIEIDGWIRENVMRLQSSENDHDLLDVIWPLMLRHIKNNSFAKFKNPSVLQDIAREWIAGRSFFDLLGSPERQKTRIGNRYLKIDHIVEICENGLAYGGSLLVGAICEIISLNESEDSKALERRLRFLQKRLKYGLSTQTEIVLYEIGFSDRVITKDIATSLELNDQQRDNIIFALNSQESKCRSLTEKYPQFYQERMNELLISSAEE